MCASVRVNVRFVWGRGVRVVGVARFASWLCACKLELVVCRVRVRACVLSAVEI